MAKIFTGALFVFCAIFLTIGCAGSRNPIIPVSFNGEPGIPSLANSTSRHQNLLLGYYDLYLDVEEKTISVSPNRVVVDNFNVTSLLNKPITVKFKLLDSTSDPTSVTFDFNISITHPFDKQHEYDCYDFRGVVIGSGVETQTTPDGRNYVFAWDSDTHLGLVDDPVNGDGGGADGYTRWYNPSEFTVTGVSPLLSYYKGYLATPGYTGNATLNPFRLFADGLNSHDDAIDFMGATGGPGNNVFAEGSTNTRNYFLKVPNTSNLKVNYALIATWAGPNPTDHPAHYGTPVAIDVKTWPSTVHAHGTGGSFRGGLTCDVTLAGYDIALPDRIVVVSDELGAKLVAGKGDVKIQASQNSQSLRTTLNVGVDGTNDAGLNNASGWIVCEWDDHPIANDYGVTWEASGEPEVIAERFEIPISDCDGTRGWAWSQLEGPFQWRSSILDVAVDTRGDVVSCGYSSGSTDIGIAYVTKLNECGERSWTYLTGGTGISRAESVVVDNEGNIIIAANYKGIMDMDSDQGGPDSISKGGFDAALIMLSPSGKYITSTIFGSTGDDLITGLDLDSGILTVIGEFSDLCDFGNGFTAYANGGSDCFIAQYNETDLEIINLEVFGGTGNERKHFIHGIHAGPDRLFLVGGTFDGSLETPVGIHPSNGGTDGYFALIDSTLNMISDDVIGGIGNDRITSGVLKSEAGIADPMIYLTGTFTESVTIGSTPLISSGGTDIFIAKYYKPHDPAGPVPTRLGGPSNDFAMDIAVNGNSGLIICGGFQGKVNFGLNGPAQDMESNGGLDRCVFFFSEAFETQWVRTSGSTGDDMLNAALSNNEESLFKKIYTGGTFSGTVDFSPGAACGNPPVEISALGETDMCLVAYTADGCM